MWQAKWANIEVQFKLNIDTNENESWVKIRRGSPLRAGFHRVDHKLNIIETGIANIHVDLSEFSVMTSRTTLVVPTQPRGGGLVSFNLNYVLN